VSPVTCSIRTGREAIRASTAERHLAPCVQQWLCFRRCWGPPAGPTSRPTSSKPWSGTCFHSPAPDGLNELKKEWKGNEGMNELKNGVTKDACRLLTAPKHALAGLARHLQQQQRQSSIACHSRQDKPTLACSLVIIASPIVPFVAGCRPASCSLHCIGSMALLLTFLAWMWVSRSVYACRISKETTLPCCAAQAKDELVSVTCW